MSALENNVIVNRYQLEIRARIDVPVRILTQQLSRIRHLSLGECNLTQDDSRQKTTTNSYLEKLYLQNVRGVDMLRQGTIILSHVTWLRLNTDIILTPGKWSDTFPSLDTLRVIDCTLVVDQSQVTDWQSVRVLELRGDTSVKTSSGDLVWSYRSKTSPDTETALVECITPVFPRAAIKIGSQQRVSECRVMYYILTNTIKCIDITEQSLTST